ncbi:MAG: sugar ABC transporter permease [Caldilineaceae bacterium]
MNWNDFTPDWTWRGLYNYQRLFINPRFQTDLWNTAVFTVVFIVAGLALGLGLALMLDSRIIGEGLFRTIFMAPLAISFVVTGVVWRWLESPNSGLNLIFHAVGLDFLQSKWFTDPHIGILGTALAALWQTSGYVMALYLAGLRGIAEELREAARIDGATELQMFLHIILPMLNSVTLSAIIVLGHISLKIFDLSLAMTGPGPGFIIDVPGMFMYETTFLGNHFSQGAAIATVMLLLVSLIIPYLVYTARTERSPLSATGLRSSLPSIPGRPQSRSTLKLAPSILRTASRCWRVCAVTSLMRSFIRPS